MSKLAVWRNGLMLGLIDEEFALAMVKDARARGWKADVLDGWVNLDGPAEDGEDD